MTTSLTLKPLPSNEVHDFPTGQEVSIRPRTVFKTVPDGPSLFTQRIDIVANLVDEGDGRSDDIVIVELEGHAAVVGGTHHFMELLPRPDADDLRRQARGNGLGDVGDPGGRDLGDEDLPSLHAPEGLKDEIDALGKGDEKTGHPGIRDRQLLRSPGDEAPEIGDDGTSRTDDIAVADDGKTGTAGTDEVVAGDEDLVGAELGGPVEVDGVGGLVRREGDHPLHVVFQGGGDDVGRAVDVGLDTFHRIVLRGGNLLERRGVDDEIDALHGQRKPRSVADIAEKIAHHRRRKLLLHLKLLQLIPGIDDEPPGLVTIEHGAYEGLSEGAGASCDEDRFGLEHKMCPLVFCQVRR